jgi:hypothetical protein
LIAFFIPGFFLKNITAPNFEDIFLEIFLPSDPYFSCPIVYPSRFSSLILGSVLTTYHLLNHPRTPLIFRYTHLKHTSLQSSIHISKHSTKQFCSTHASLTHRPISASRTNHTTRSLFQPRSLSRPIPHYNPTPTQPEYTRYPSHPTL